MRDGYGRRIEYLRISVTDKCNLRCLYCMPHDIRSLPMKEILTYEEIAAIAETAASLGITRIKITGGEPLVRRDVCRLIGMLKKIPGIKQVTLTTNGVLLKEHLEGLMAVGIDGINISIDTADPKRYERITGSDTLGAVLEGLTEALRYHIPVRVNAVSLDPAFFAETEAEHDPLKEAAALIELARERPIDVRFIELMPIGAGKSFPGIPHDVLIPLLLKRFPALARDEKKHGNGPAVYYRMPGYQGSIGFISAVHGMFCDSCNRIRLTAQGYLKSCLCYDTGIDLKEILRSSLPEPEKNRALAAGMEKAILCKPKAHSFAKQENISEKHAMSAIGG
ncbi:MAG: GTP 3',8-cyclase MoaA [Lachnospiraceae bacterium]|nr:GTP 3',8-cyclase MoaA [Lachnospiraceae bacterium]